MKTKFANLMLLHILIFSVAQAEVTPPPRPVQSTYCAQNVASTTTYFVPHIKDYCPEPEESPCPKFPREVRMQGTGTLAGNKVLRYTGKVEYLGKCSTAIGAAGKCLLPYFSVAADPRFYRMGDIINMPGMKGKTVTMPDGTEMEHPGFFIVHDTGGAVKGPNRFDFFTGSMGLLNTKNTFGAKNPLTSMSAKNQCSSRKRFSVIRRGSDKYQQSLAMIEQTSAGGPATPAPTVLASVPASVNSESV